MHIWWMLLIYICQFLMLLLPTLSSFETTDIADQLNLNGEPFDERQFTDEKTFVRPVMSDTARCFSCMSKFYEAVWPVLSSVYKRPRNFSDRCDDEHIDPNYVPISHCPTICIRMWEEPTVAGVKIRGHIRGCLDEILHNGFNQTIVSWYRWMHRDSCRQYRKRELFKLPVEKSDDSLINVCTCYADYCNGSETSLAVGLSLPSLIICFLVIFLPVYRI
ncbi:hypothetical protein AB6A40_007538 [Gnathostoma spinigerum]|uniref:Uncharacterized protein n=1 Tax=Gnathostoma spinigerum TaxID=75299 RepID=A0ABD6ERM8_9BILA